MSAAPGGELTPRFRPLAIFLGFILAAAACASRAEDSFAAGGERALEFTRRAVEFGPRPAGSDAQRRQREWIVETLSELGCEVEVREFVAETPLARRAMANVIAKFDDPDGDGRFSVVSGHYDTLERAGVRFVGANDGGSSTGLLLALAEILDRRAWDGSVWLVFFDGEESTREWRDGDHTYGSRRLAEQWAAAGLRDRARALINVDMIGDADLRVAYEGNSTPWLRELVWSVAARLGYEREFSRQAPAYIEDDHVEFLRRGFPALDLIDFEYGFMNRYWHTENDSLDKLDARSFAVVLRVLVESLKELEKRP